MYTYVYSLSLYLHLSLVPSFSADPGTKVAVGPASAPSVWTRRNVPWADHQNNDWADFLGVP
jgi:hypothetical protein